MTVALWWQATSTVIDTALALMTLVMAILLTWLSVNPARHGRIAPAAAVTVALAVMLRLAPHTAAAGELQDALNRQMAADGPYASQMWSTVWSNIHTMTVCTVLLHYIVAALAVLMVTAVLITAFAAVRRYANHPAAQRVESVMVTLRRAAVTKFVRPQETGVIERAAAQSDWLKRAFAQPRPTLLALGAMLAIAGIVGFIGLLNSVTTSTATQQMFVEPAAAAPVENNGSGPLPLSSQPATEPIAPIPFPLTNEPCSFETSCAIRNANGRFTLDLAHTSTLRSVSLVPDELIPGRVVTKARWDFADQDQTSHTVDYDPITDRGWSVIHDLGAGVRTAQFALTVLSSVPIDPHAGPPPGPGLAAVLSATTGPRGVGIPGARVREDAPASTTPPR